jgi:hypothetical protein
MLGPCRRAFSQVVPPSTLTSIRVIGAFADHERPLSTCCRPTGNSAKKGSSKALFIV